MDEWVGWRMDLEDQAKLGKLEPHLWKTKLNYVGKLEPHLWKTKLN